MSRDHPALALGLHWDVRGEDEREFDIGDLRAVRDEFHRLRRMPTHVDSHRHAHREKIREEVGEGWTENSVHPGYLSPDYTTVYLTER